MKKMGLLLILSGLLLVGAGCGGGGGSSSESESFIATVDVNSGYKVNTSTSSTNTVTMTINSIGVKSGGTLKVNCIWIGENNSSDINDIITKLSDKGTATFYMYDNKGKKYYHTNGTGAAYADVILGTTAVSGAYYFPALDSEAKTICFYDTTYGQTIGPINVSW
jgi:ABC-type glycerol-3-phosphate transport system substrate-binding protein